MKMERYQLGSTVVPPYPQQTLQHPQWMHETVVNPPYAMFVPTHKSVTIYKLSTVKDKAITNNKTAQHSIMKSFMNVVSFSQNTL